MNLQSTGTLQLRPPISLMIGIYYLEQTDTYFYTTKLPENSCWTELQEIGSKYEVFQLLNQDFRKREIREVLKC